MSAPSPRCSTDLETARAYVNRAIASYVGDPADNQFQKGFLAALEVIRDEAFPPREKCPHCLGSCNPLPEGSGYCEKCQGTGWAQSADVAQQPVPRGEPPLAKLLKEVDPGLADILTDNASWVALIRNNVVTACANIANAEFERELSKIEAATDDKALSETGRREIQQRADAGALSAQRIASQIRALSIPSTEGK